ncbi:hypothetical protein DY000_02062492 [Brassica cretica]|uniref:Leucine-rich repeat-containing N-terminal plant-type domain-containing protein n=1 Tax=Brassica cretica TaxID=69181 RepID=A0ABQ7AYJ5_BRACR|nr:hypothetical protein DY000_02062492 [Brassica cretica]
MLFIDKGAYICDRKACLLKCLARLSFVFIQNKRFSFTGYKSLGRLRNLEILDLSYNEFNSSIFPFLSAATSLKTLFLGFNRMDGPFPAEELKDLINLQLLDLSQTNLNGSIPIQELSVLRKLEALDLSDNEFSGSLESQGKTNHILSYSIKTGGQLPLCLTRLTRLQVLDLSYNQLTGNVPSALGKLESLKYLSLVENNFEGSFSIGSLANLSELMVLKLGSKSLSFQVESESNWKPKIQMSVIILSSCNLVKVPHFLLYQKDLIVIDLSGNKISGIFPPWLLANNKKLEALLLQNNLFTSFQLPKSAHGLLYLDVSVNKFNHLLPENIGLILSHLRYMKLFDSGFQGNLPSSIGNMKSIVYLDISNNRFHGVLPRSFLMGCYSLEILRLSHNKLSGEVFSESVNLTRIVELSMDNNQFTVKNGQGFRSFESLELLDISSNGLTGVIPSWIGELHLRALQVSNNSLEGEIPISLFNLSALQLLDLSANNLSGDIPPHVNSFKVALLLQDNHLSGEIPGTLQNVSVLDLRNNRLSGNIPEFTNTQNISVLLLQGNNLTGHIPRQLCDLSNIHLLDLANNSLSGSIPSCFRNTSFAELGVLLELQGLNLSHNKLSGAIPETFSGLKNVESLDLSFNMLHGHIPPQLTDLSSLAVFNVSFNNLSGVIPQGRQFNTFDSQSFLGNPLLCGKQINRSCNNSNFQVPDNEVKVDESQIDMVSFYWSSAAAYVTVLLGIFLSLSFDSPWRSFWFYMVDAFIYKAKNLLW